MATFYIVDALGLLSPGRVLTLDQIEQPQADAEGEPPWFREALAQYPTGLSHHGRRYYVDGSEGPTNNLLELTWELVRRERFPDAPSRLQSVFACDSIPDVLRFREECRTGQGAMWQVHADVFFRADMHLLDSGPLGETLDRTCRYWQGLPSKTKEPLWEYLLTPPVRVVGPVYYGGD